MYSLPKNANTIQKKAYDKGYQEAKQDLDTSPDIYRGNESWIDQDNLSDYDLYVKWYIIGYKDFSNSEGVSK